VAFGVSLPTSVPDYGRPAAGGVKRQNNSTTALGDAAITRIGPSGFYGKQGEVLTQGRLRRSGRGV